jgi:hypothetical protein
VRNVVCGALLSLFYIYFHNQLSCYYPIVSGASQSSFKTLAPAPVQMLYFFTCAHLVTARSFFRNALCVLVRARWLKILDVLEKEKDTGAHTRQLKKEWLSV